MSTFNDGSPLSNSEKGGTRIFARRHYTTFPCVGSRCNVGTCRRSRNGKGIPRNKTYPRKFSGWAIIWCKWMFYGKTYNANTRDLECDSLSVHPDRYSRSVWTNGKTNLWDIRPPKQPQSPILQYIKHPQVPPAQKACCMGSYPNRYLYSNSTPTSTP